jgi:hypothetical protein
MTKALFFVAIMVAPCICYGQWEDEQLILLRGDASSDGVVNMADATCITNYLFLGGPAPPCMNQADANNDGVVNTSDAIFLLAWLYNGGSPPPAPGPYNTVCTLDDDPYPGCVVNPCE